MRETPGEPPTITWDLPPDVQAGPILWPVPKRIDVEPFVNYGYEEEVLLPIPMQIATTFGGARLVLAADVHWLVCKEECVPGQANLTLPVPIRQGQSTPEPRWSTLFEATLRMLPRQPPPHWRLAGHPWSRTRFTSWFKASQAPLRQPASFRWKAITSNTPRHSKSTRPGPLSSLNCSALVAFSMR